MKNKREDIMVAVIHLLEEKGAKRVTMDAISGSISISKRFYISLLPIRMKCYYNTLNTHLNHFNPQSKKKLKVFPTLWKY